MTECLQVLKMENYSHTAELGIMKHSGKAEVAKIYHIRKDIHQKIYTAENGRECSRVSFFMKHSDGA